MIEIKGQVVPERVTEDTDFFNRVYNPDVLLCLANLSNDEVFTPPEIANQMLDMLPQGLFEDPNTTFLDPACKSGVFLREIAKRLIKGLENKIPDLEERIDHICKHQLYGIAITELTSLLSRRSVYCSKYPNGPFSIAKFENVEGNIRFKNCDHEWEGSVKWARENGIEKRVWRTCKWCGTSEELFGKDNRSELESHAYEFIHKNNPEEIFSMKFDVIISNPPYQLNDGGAGASAKPIYQLFVQKAKELNPRYLTMIIPSRWYAGGKGLDSFRKEMLEDRHISHLVDYVNAKECFPGTSIGGGVCYFLRDSNYQGNCNYKNVHDGKASEVSRNLGEYDVFVRYNEAMSIIRKVEVFSEKPFSEYVGSRNPFGLSSNVRGDTQKREYRVFSSGGSGYITSNTVKQGRANADKYKVMISKVTAEHAGEPDKNGMFSVLSTTRVLKPKDVCTDSYLIVYPTDSENRVVNCAKYMCTKFFRFLLLQAVTSINLSKDKFQFIPQQDFSEEWTDEKLYRKYSLNEEEIDFIENMIKDKQVEV